jgi:hypothetical protein
VLHFLRASLRRKVAASGDSVGNTAHINYKPVLGVLLAAFAAAGCDIGPERPTVNDVVVSTADVHHFVSAKKQITPGDTTCAALDGYIRSGTAGLDAYRSKFDVGRQELCTALRRSPDHYARLDMLLPGLDSASKEISVLFARFQKISPSAKMPSVYFIVGNGISGGTTTHGSAPMILIGTELTRSTAGLPRTIAHELAHTQQRYPWWRSLTGGPRFLRADLLRQSLVEGTADVVAEFLTGKPNRSQYGEAHEAELWAQFKRDMHSRNYGGWLYNGREKAADPNRPADLGYWVGYRIAKAYYDRSPDKAQAVRDMLTISDFDAFVARSGYRGGA